MHEVGTPSWSLSVSHDPRPFALYVRDALELDVSGEGLSPPPLSPRPPSRRELLSAAERAQVGADWAGWWRAVLHHEAVLHSVRPPGSDFVTWYRRLAAERDAEVGEAPDFAALADRPALHRACMVLSPHARDWDRYEPVEGSTTEPVTSLNLSGIAAVIADLHGVDVDRLHGLVLAVDVEGAWWRVVEPGVLVCSTVSVDTEPERLVREVLESSLRS